MQTALRSQMAFRPATSRPARLVVANSAVATPATLPYKAVDGSSKGSAELALKVAEDTAKGLVHRYMVLVQQNARRVRQTQRSRLLAPGRARGGLPLVARRDSQLGPPQPRAHALC